MISVKLLIFLSAAFFFKCRSHQNRSPDGQRWHGARWGRVAAPSLCCRRGFCSPGGCQGWGHCAPSGQEVLQHCCWGAEPCPGIWLSLVHFLGFIPRQHLPQSASCLAQQEPDGVLILDQFSRAILHILRQLLRFAEVFLCESCSTASPAVPAPCALPAAKGDPETRGGEGLVPKKGGRERESAVFVIRCRWEARD